MSIKTMKRDKREKARKQALKSVLDLYAPLTIDGEIKRMEKHIDLLVKLYTDTVRKHGDAPHYQSALVRLYIEIEKSVNRLMSLKIDKLNTV